MASGRLRRSSEFRVLRFELAAASEGARGFYRELRETHDRTTARWPSAPWMLARASAKRVISHESHDLARCSKWAHLHFSSACASVQTGASLGPFGRFCPLFTARTQPRESKAPSLTSQHPGPTHSTVKRLLTKIKKFSILVNRQP